MFLKVTSPIDEGNSKSELFISIASIRQMVLIDHDPSHRGKYLIRTKKRSYLALAKDVKPLLS